MLEKVADFLSMYDNMQFLGAFFVLFAIVNIVGVVPLAVKLRADGYTIDSGRAALITLCLFLGFMYMGGAFLNLFSLELSSFAIAGSIIIFIIAMEMILDMQIFYKNKYPLTDVTFTPIVFPLIAGAGAFTTILSIRSQFADVNIVLAIILNVLIVYYGLKFAAKFEKILSPGIICIFRKAFGIILLSIAVKLFTYNLAMLVKGTPLN